MDIPTLLSSCADAVVPEWANEFLRSLARQTGLRWGPSTESQYWFQSPQEHILQFILVACFCAVLYRACKGFRQEAISSLALQGPGWSTKCPINTFIAVVLMGCFGVQVWAKGVRAQPFIQLGWLLMPCHLITLTWIYIFLHEKPQHYGRNCYLASLLIDWLWSPLGAAASPDWGDHQFAFEGTVFWIHHGLLIFLPFYYAIRYHTLPITRKHLAHLTLVPVFISFFLFTPYAMFTGLNLNYMLYPPPVKGIPAVFRSPFYRLYYVTAQIVLSAFLNVVVRGVASVVTSVINTAERAKKKLS